MVSISPIFAAHVGDGSMSEIIRRRWGNQPGPYAATTQTAPAAGTAQTAQPILPTPTVPTTPSAPSKPKDEIDKWLGSFNTNIEQETKIANDIFSKGIKNFSLTTDETKKLLSCCKKLDSAIKENQPESKVKEVMDEFIETFKSTGTYRKVVMQYLSKAETEINLIPEDEIGRICYLFFNNHYGEHSGKKMESLAQKWQKDNNSNLISDYFPDIKNLYGHTKAVHARYLENFRTNASLLCSSLRAGTDYSIQLQNTENAGNRLFNLGSTTYYSSSNNSVPTTLSVSKNPGALYSTIVKYTNNNPFEAIDQGPLAGDKEAQLYEGFTFGFYDKKGNTQTDLKRKFNPKYEKESTWFGRGCARAAGGFASGAAVGGTVGGGIGAYAGAHAGGIGAVPGAWAGAKIGAGIGGVASAIVNFFIGAFDDE